MSLILEYLSLYYIEQWHLIDRSKEIKMREIRCTYYRLFAHIVLNEFVLNLSNHLHREYDEDNEKKTREPK